MRGPAHAHAVGGVHRPGHVERGHRRLEARAATRRTPRRRGGSRPARARRRGRSWPSRNRASPSCARSSGSRSRACPARPRRPGARCGRGRGRRWPTPRPSRRGPSSSRTSSAPVSTHSSPSLRARVWMRATSLPAPGSVIAIAPQRAREWSVKICRNRSRCSGVAVLRSAGPPRPGPGQRQGHAAVPVRRLLADAGSCAPASSRARRRALVVADHAGDDAALARADQVELVVDRRRHRRCGRPPAPSGGCACDRGRAPPRAAPAVRGSSSIIGRPLGAADRRRRARTRRRRLRRRRAPPASMRQHAGLAEALLGEVVDDEAVAAEQLDAEVGGDETRRRSPPATPAWPRSRRRARRRRTRPRRRARPGGRRAPRAAAWRGRTRCPGGGRPACRTRPARWCRRSCRRAPRGHTDRDRRRPQPGPGAHAERRPTGQLPAARDGVVQRDGRRRPTPGTRATATGVGPRVTSSRRSVSPSITQTHRSAGQPGRPFETSDAAARDRPR